MDRIIARKDSNGVPIIFLSDSLKNNSILAVRPEAGSEPFLASLDWYKLAQPLPDAQAKQVAKIYEKEWQQETLLMKRLPRVVYNSPEMTKTIKAAQHARKMEGGKEPVKQQVEHTAPELAKSVEAPKPQGYIMRKAGSLWRVQDAQGSSVAYTVTEEDALKVLQDLLGPTATFHH